MVKPCDSGPADDELSRIRQEAMLFAGIGLYRYAFDGTILFIDQGAFEILELEHRFSTPAEVAGRNLSEIAHAKTRGALRDEVRKRGSVHRFENQFRTLEGNERWAIHDSYLVRDPETGEESVQVVIRDVTSRKHAELALEYRLELEALIMRVSTELIGLAPRQMDEGITRALHQIGEFAGVDRSYVFLFSEDLAVMDNTHEWCRDGIEPQMQRLQHVPSDSFPWLMSKLRSNETVHIPSVSEMGPEAAPERGQFEAEGIRSLLALPMVCGESLIGIVGFDSVRCERTWTEDIIAVLKIVSEMLANAITRQRAEQTLRERERQYRRLFNEMLAGFVLLEAVYDDDGVPIDARILQANPAFERIMRIAAEAIVGKRIRTALAGIDPAWLELIKRVVLTGEPVQFQRQTRRGDRWFDVAAFCPSSGQVVMTFLDITERKRVEEALTRREQQLAAAQRLAQVGSWEWSAARGQLWCSAEMSRLLGLEPTESWISFEDLLDRIHPDDRDFVREETSKAWRTGERLNYRHRVVHPDGTVLTLLSMGHVMQEAKGEPTKMMGAAQDITERERAEQERRSLEEQVRHAQKLESLGVLAGGIAHDFNNLLMGVLGNADLALQDMSPTAPARESVEAIEAAARRAAELCRQMLAYSGKGRFVVQPLNLSEVIMETSHLLEVSISKKATLRYDCAEKLPAVEGDVTQIRQIVMNLITNASDALGDRSGVISVRTGVMRCDRSYLRETYLDEDLPEGDYVCLEVSDTGCGMDEATREKIFDPFFSTKFTGRGLGLAAVLGIVLGHQGAIRVYSELGRGSTFKVLLPASNQGVEPVSDVEGAVQWRGSGTILVIDDEETVRKLATRMLERCGFEVVAAPDGREGVEVFRARANEIRAVILDMTMPHLSGEETYRELRRIREGVRVVLSSGYDEEEAVASFAGKGLAGFLQKPYQQATLTGVLQKALEEDE